MLRSVSICDRLLVVVYSPAWVYWRTTKSCFKNSPARTVELCPFSVTVQSAGPRRGAWAGSKCHACLKTISVQLFKHEANTRELVRGHVCLQAVPAGPVFAVEHHLARLDAPQPVSGGHFALATGMGGCGKAVHPADVVPIDEVKNLNHSATALER